MNQDTKEFVKQQLEEVSKEREETVITYDMGNITTFDFQLDVNNTRTVSSSLIVGDSRFDNDGRVDTLSLRLPGVGGKPNKILDEKQDELLELAVQAGFPEDTHIFIRPRTGKVHLRLERISQRGLSVPDIVELIQELIEITEEEFYNSSLQINENES
jgi:hypothetical protein